MDLYQKTEQFVIDSFTKAGDERGIKHFLRTVYWLEQLKPNADEALKIAAVAHDIERAFRKQDYANVFNSEKGFASDEHLSYHQTEGAKIISEFLKKEGADKKIVERVKMLVEKHEIGGNEDQNLVKDADSVSFFENNANHFIEVKVKQTSKEKVKDKFDWMFNRITSDKAKELAKPWYEEGLHKLSLLD
ncbi:DUF4202 family protein [Candidatus Nomurabacteria bacterium]|nr:DUF4202 family protein [Candidatus Nomurabacteria bacterium]